MTGEQLGPYRLMGRIGEGGMSVVHLGLDPRGVPVAVKVLKPHVAGDPAGRERFAREVRALRRVRGPHVAEVLDAAVDGPGDTVTPYVVTRYVPGRPLDVVVATEGPLTPPALAELGTGLAQALCVIHAAGVVHRDLKPGNVLVADGVPTVIDFGIAALADDSRLTSSGLVVGTPGFLAPEVVRGEPATPAADVHAWGATLAYAATGRPPFGRGPLEVVLGNICRGAADLRGVPPTVAPLVRAALAHRPEDRPAPAELLRWCDAGGGEEPTQVIVARAVPPAGEPTVILPRPAGPSAEVAPPDPTWSLPVGPDPPRDPTWSLPAAPPVGPDPPPAVVVPPARQRHRLGALALLGLAAAVTALVPVVAGAAVLAGMATLRIADAAALARLGRRARRGPRRGDAARVVGSLPWHAARGVLATCWHLPVPLLAAALAAAPAGWMTEGSRPGSGWTAATVAAVVVGVLVSWTGAGGAPLRRASSWALDRMMPSRAAGILAVAVLLAAAVLAAGAAAWSPSTWWPADRPPPPPLLGRLPDPPA